MPENHQQNQNLTKIDVDQHLPLTLNYVDMKPTIHLDSFIPRICQIATTSVDRKSKLAACELTHAIILYMIGRERHTGALWRLLCDTMLQLACDGDVAVQQLFDPLLLQITHFLSQRSQLLSDGVAVLFDCLMDGISYANGGQAAVRDMAARSLREFLSFCIRQSSAEQLAASPTSLLGVIALLRMYSFDSSPAKRFGAALAFNNLYRIVREHDWLVDIAWLDILYTFSVNYMMSEEFSRSRSRTDDFAQVSISLDHVARVLRERRTLLNRSNPERLVPGAYTGGTLMHAMLWLFGQCGAHQMLYRRKCIELVKQVAPYVDVIVGGGAAGGSVKAFVSGTQTAESIFAIFEGSLRPNLRHIAVGGEAKSPVVAILVWLEHILATLDGYTWILGDGLTDRNTAETIVSSTKLFSVIGYFIKNISCVSLVDILSEVHPEFDFADSNQINFSTAVVVMDKIDRMKAEVLHNIFDFFLKCLPTFGQLITSDFWADCGTELIKVVNQIIYMPQAVGFEQIRSREKVAEIQRKMNQFIDLAATIATPVFADQLSSVLLAELSREYIQTTQLAAQHLRCANITLNRLNTVKGLELMCRRYADLPILGTNKLLFDLFNGLKEEAIADGATATTAVTIPSDARRYAEILLRIALTPNPLRLIVSLILDPTELHQSRTQTIIAHGQYFLETFKRNIFAYFLRAADEAIYEFSSQLTVEYLPLICKVFIDLCQFTGKNHQHDLQLRKTVVNAMLTGWPNMVAIVERSDGCTAAVVADDAFSFVLIELLSNIALICPYQLSDINRQGDGRIEPWLLHILGDSTRSIEIKTRALFLLPCLVDATHTEHQGVTTALRALQLQYFPISSAEFVVGSLRRTAFVNLFQTLLDAMVASRSPIIVRFVIECTATDAKHIMETEIVDGLSRLLARQTEREQVDTMNLPMAMFIDSSVATLEPSVRGTILKRFLVRALQFCRLEALLRFFELHMKEIIDLCDRNYRVMVGSGSTWAMEHGLVSRIGAYQLVESLFAVPDRELHDKQDQLVSTLPGK